MSTGRDALGRDSQLQEEVTRLRAENRRLLAALERLANGDPGPGSGPVAADPVAAQPLLDSPGEADGDQAALATAAVVRSPLLAGASNWSDTTTYLQSADPGSVIYVLGNGRGVSGVAQGPGLHGFSYTQNGVVGQGVANGLNGVQGQAVNPGASGVYGQHDNAGYGVAGRSSNIGVFGESTGSGVGVYGTSTSGDGVQAVSQNQSGVNGASTNSYGVRGFSANSVGVLAASNSSTGAGLLAQNDSGTPGGVAVIALGQAGVGVYASGEHAAVQLGRNSLSGAPTAGFHTVGELVLDANADLYLCKASGTPGTWKLLG
jgi:hypothetical protein